MLPPVRILMLTYGNWNHPSSRIRAAQYIVLFGKTGKYTVKWIPRVANPIKNLIGKYFIFPLIKRWLFLYRFLYLIFTTPDLIFVQRDFINPMLLRLIKAKKIKIIYDFDDAIYLDKPGSGKNYDHTSMMLKSASAVIVSSEDLIPFASSINPKVFVIPSPVNIIKTNAFEKVSGDKNIVTIGWIGSSTTAKYLNEIKESLTEIAGKTKFRLLIIGANVRFDLPGIEVEYMEWSLEKEPEFLNQMDIGIMPLPDNEWTKGKGGYKLYLYSSAGLPLLASPVGINKRIVIHGENGFLAGTSKEWTQYLDLLINDEELRYKLGDKALEIAKQNYSLEVCFDQLISVFKTI